MKNVILARIAAGSFAIASLFFVFSFFFGEFEVAITQDMANEKVSERLPYSKQSSFMKKQWDVNVPSLAITFVPSAILIAGNANGGTENNRFQTDFGASGGLAYRDGKIFADIIHIEMSEIKTKDGENLALKAAKKGLDVIEALGLSKGGDADAVAGMISGNINKAVSGSVKALLQRVPVYELPDSVMGGLARAAVSDIEVRGEEVIVHLSLWQFSKSVLIMLAAMAVSLILVFLLASMGGVGLAAIIGMGLVS